MCNVGWCKYAPQSSMCQVFTVPIASCICLTQQKKRAANQRDSVRQWGASPQGKALLGPNPRGAPQLPPPLASCASHVFQCRARDKGRVGRNGKEEVDDETDGREGERMWWEESEQVRRCRPPSPSPRGLSVRGELVSLRLLAAIMGGGAGGGGSGCGGGSRRGGSNFGSEALSALARRRGKVVEFGGQQGKRGSGGSSSGTGGFHQLAERDCQGARRGGRVGGGPRGRVGRAQVKGQVLMQFHACVDEVLR